MYRIYSKCIPQRYLVAVECFLCLALSYMMRFCLSMTITEMTTISGNEEHLPYCPDPTADSKKEKEQNKKMEFHWTPQEQALIHGSFFWGYFVTTMVGGIMSDLFNHKTIMLSGLLATCIVTAFTPLITRAWDWSGLIICRIFVGLAQGVFYNSLLAITARWIPPVEQGTLGTIVFSGTHFGSSLNILGTGNLMEIYDWTIPFYIYSGTGLIILLLFTFTTKSEPLDTGITDKETTIFSDYMKHVFDKTKVPKKVPIKLISKNVHVWAIIIAAFGQSWCVFTILVFIPTYMKSILHMSLQQTTLYNTLMFIITWILAILSGFIADVVQRKKCIPLTWNRKLLYLIGTLFPAVSFVGVAFAGCRPKLTMIFLLVGISTIGFFYPSVKVNPMDLSPNYAGTIGALAQMGSSTAGVMVPYVTGGITAKGTIAEWKIVFWICGAVVLAGGILFFSLASSNEQPFNEYYANYLNLEPNVRREDHLMKLNVKMDNKRNI